MAELLIIRILWNQPDRYLFSWNAPFWQI